ncbi:MAG: hypothetical protein ACI8RD_009175 [Bacillariaceae sp.]|jgi:hypothetical protein
MAAAPTKREAKRSRRDDVEDSFMVDLVVVEKRRSAVVL